jgi:hypothetical protein
MIIPILILIPFNRYGKIKGTEKIRKKDTCTQKEKALPEPGGLQNSNLFLMDYQR